MNKQVQLLHRKITAYHEAAHVVVALHLGMRVHHVSLSRVSPQAGLTTIRRIPLLLSADIDANAPPAQLWKTIKRDAEEHIMILLAGPLAESKLHGTKLRSDGAQSDLSQVADLCDMLENFRCLVNQHYPIPALETRSLASHLRQRTRRLLGQPPVWRAVTAVATDLLDWRSLSGNDAADIVQFTKQRTGQFSLGLPIPES